MKRFITLLKDNVEQAINDFCNRYLPIQEEKTTIFFPAIFNKEKEIVDSINIHISRTTPYFYLVLPYGFGSRSYIHLVKDKEGIHSFFAFLPRFYPSQISISGEFDYRIREIIAILKNSYVFTLIEQEREKTKEKEKEIEELKQQIKNIEKEIIELKNQQFNVNDFLSFYFKSCFPACGVIKDYKTLKDVIKKMFTQYKEANHAD